MDYPDQQEFLADIYKKIMSNLKWIINSIFTIIED